MFSFQVPADVEKCQDRMECFNADLKADMERRQLPSQLGFELLRGGKRVSVQNPEFTKRSGNVAQ